MRRIRKLEKDMATCKLHDENYAIELEKIKKVVSR
jgi:hypothetical protein